MSGETCPHCGSEAIIPEWDGYCQQWSCQSRRLKYFSDNPIVVSPKCKDRELAALRQQLAEVTAERDTWKSGKETWANAAIRETKRAETAEQQLADLQRRIAAAPVAWVVLNEHGEVVGLSRGVVMKMSGNGTARMCRLLAEPE